MRLKLTTILLLILFITTFPQGRGGGGGRGGGNPEPIGTVKGTLIDGNTKTPVEYGNIVLFSLRDSSMTTGTVSTESGEFLIDKLMPGVYYASISFIGYEKVFIDTLLIFPQKPLVDLGVVNIFPASISVGEVQVTADREAIISNLDKKVINVEKMITAAGGTALDVMQNIPSVTVSGEGEVSLRGNPNIRILIDGKPAGMTGISEGDILAQIPASSIEAVELVTNPSARYDPDGTAGIINIKLKRNTDIGLNGMVSANAGTGDNYNSSLNLNMRQGELNFNLSYDMRMGNNISSSNSTRENYLSSSTPYLFQNSSGNFGRGSHNLKFNVDWLPGDFDKLSFNFQFRNFGGENANTINNIVSDALQTPTDFYRRYSEGSRDMRSFQTMMSYVRTFTDKNQEFTADFIFSDNKMDRDQISRLEFFNANPFTQENSESRNNNRMIVAQANYTQGLFEGSKIETGFKSSFRDFTLKNDYFTVLLDGSLAPNPSKGINLTYDEQIHAGYLIFTSSIEKLKYQFGLRAEQANIDAQGGTNTPNFGTDYFALYPSVFFAYGLGQVQEVRLNYSRRVDRPHPRQLNPYVDYSDSLNISFGNPQLDPQFTNSIELGYSNFIGKTSINSTVFFRNTDDIISSVTSMRPDGVTETTFRNVAKSQSYGIEINGSTELFKGFRISPNFSYFNTKFEDPFNLRNPAREDYSWNARVMANLTVGDGFQFQMMFFYNAPNVTIQGRTEENYSADFAVRKDFLDGNLSLTLRFSDIFDSMKFNSVTSAPGFQLTSDRKWESRNVYLGIQYMFNSFKRERERSIDMNNDLETF